MDGGDRVMWEALENTRACSYSVLKVLCVAFSYINTAHTTNTLARWVAAILFQFIVNAFKYETEVNTRVFFSIWLPRKGLSCLNVPAVMCSESLIARPLSPHCVSALCQHWRKVWLNPSSFCANHNSLNQSQPHMQ